MVSNLATNVETGQKAVMKDFKNMLGSFMSSFVIPVHQERKNVGVGVNLDEMRDEVVGSEKTVSGQVNNEDGSQLDCGDEIHIESKEEKIF